MHHVVYCNISLLNALFRQHQLEATGGVSVCSIVPAHMFTEHDMCHAQGCPKVHSLQDTVGHNTEIKSRCCYLKTSQPKDEMWRSMAHVLLCADVRCKVL